MIAQFQFGIETKTINVETNVATEVIFGDANNQAIITGFYMETFDGNYVAQWRFTQPSLDRILLEAVNAPMPNAKITLFGGMLQTPVPPQVLQTLIR